MKRFTVSADYIAILFGYFDSWSVIDHPDYHRGALRCKTQALVYADRTVANNHE